MNIGIDCASFRKKQTTGIGRYASHLVQSLAQIDSENKYFLYTRRGFFQFSNRIPKIKAKNFYSCVDYFKRGPEQTLKDIDVFHCPHHGELNFRRAKTVATIHDLIHKVFPQGHTPQTIELAEKGMQSVLANADKIICCSESTIADVQKYFGVSRDKLSLIYQGVDKTTFYPIDEEERAKARKVLLSKGIDQAFILFVGTIEPRKNLNNLLKAFSILKGNKGFNGCLVVVGMKGWMSESLEKTIDELGLRSRVIILGYVHDEELRFLYNEAQVFVFPSFYEGFGFPIIEAFSCGTPVVCSNVSSCKELGEGAAMMVDPNNPDDMARAVARVVQEDKLRKDLADRGIRRAKDFSFKRTAEKTLLVYKELVQSR